MAVWNSDDETGWNLIIGVENGDYATCWWQWMAPLLFDEVKVIGSKIWVIDGPVFPYSLHIGSVSAKQFNRFGSGADRKWPATNQRWLWAKVERWTINNNPQRDWQKQQKRPKNVKSERQQQQQQQQQTTWVHPKATFMQRQKKNIHRKKSGNKKKIEKGNVKIFGNLLQRKWGDVIKRNFHVTYQQRWWLLREVWQRRRLPLCGCWPVETQNSSIKSSTLSFPS